jgi:hexosaminidase
VPKQLSAEEAKHVLGAQGQIWTEYMPDPKRVEYMAWPRLVALSEVLWSPPETRDLASFKSRLDTHLKRLAILDVNYRGRFSTPE